MKKETLYELQKEMKKHLGDKWDLRITAEKTLDGIQDAISCRYGKESRLVIVYPSEYERAFGNDVNITEMGQYLASLAQDKQAIASTLPVTEKEFREGLYIQVANAEMRKDSLKDMVYDYVTDDIVAIARCRGRVTEAGQASLLVTREKMQKYHMSRGEIMELAYKNTRNQKFEMETLIDCFRGILEREGTPKEMIDLMAPREDVGVYVLSAKSRINGANVLVCPEALKKSYEKLGEPYYVLPSSIHEVLLVKESCALPLDEMTELVQMVNKKEVSAADLLSNRVFFYDGRKLTVASEEVKQAAEALEHTVNHKRIP